MSVTVRIETITPKKAVEFLALNIANRSEKPVRILEMAHDMKEGRWALNGESIKLGQMNGSSVDDVLVDGQNRAHAIIKSGVAIESVVVRGLAYQDSMPTVDAGAKRTMGDVLKLLGEKHNAALAAVTSVAYRQEMRKGKDRGFIGTHNDLLRYLEDNPLLRDATERAYRVNRKFPIKISALGAAIFHGYGVDKPSVETFAQKLESGENLNAGDPVYVLRSWLTNALAASRNPSVDAYVTVTNKALIAELEGRSINKLMYRASQPFPYVQDAEIVES